MLSAYLRPDPASDLKYLALRDSRIEDIVTGFSKSFRSYSNAKYSADDASRSLTAILKDGVELGLVLFSQAATLSFSWPTQTKIGREQIAISPALVRSSDERGKTLSTKQTLVERVLKKL